MSALTTRIVIIGASIAGVNVAKMLRKQNFEGQITVIDQQSELPYDLLPLSKEWMLDTENVNPPLLSKKDFYKENEITLKLNTTIERLDPTTKTIYTAENEAISYDKLVIAIGSVLRKLDVPGKDASGIFYLRDFQQATQIKQSAQTAKDVVIVGAGFIGLELASTFSQLGLNVTVLERSAAPLKRILGEEASNYFSKMHQSHDVNILTNEEVQQFIQDNNGKVSAVMTKTGKNIPCDLAIVGIGVVPNTSISHPDLAFDRGIIVNEYGETSISDVYAAGDCTIWPYQDKQLHIEHWEHAYHHGRTIAKNLMNEKSHPYQVRPYFWTDEYDQTFEYLGHAVDWHKTIIRGSLEERQFTIAYVDENNVPLAILFANEGDKRKDVAAFMDEKKPIDEERFKNMEVPLG